MIGLDTNVVVRLLANDEQQQVARAKAIIEQCASTREPAFIGNVVLIEVYWVLSAAYRYPRDVIVAALRALLTANDIRVERVDEVRAALDACAAGANFSDALIGLSHQRAGCEVTVTFDSDASRELETFRLL